jgi:enamine deaminase RidA (YjgF/YER057c/UK114 family)
MSFFHTTMIPMPPTHRITTPSPWEPLIGYCRAVVAPPWVLVSGTTGTDHATGEIPETVEAQCALALRIIESALHQAGASLKDVVRVRYILPDRRDFEPCWPLLAAAFGAHPPAATMMEAGLIDPRHRIEIEVDALLPEA